MGYNLHARCLDHGVTAFVFRGREAVAIHEWYERHPRCRTEWGVDNNHTTPDWVEAEADLQLPVGCAV